MIENQYLNKSLSGNYGCLIFKAVKNITRDKKNPLEKLYKFTDYRLLKSDRLVRIVM